MQSFDRFERNVVRSISWIAAGATIFFLMVSRAIHEPVAAESLLGFAYRPYNIASCARQWALGPSGEIGRHSGLKIRRFVNSGRTGSIPVSGTK